jgi:hypothetical protein
MDWQQVTVALWLVLAFVGSTSRNFHRTRAKEQPGISIAMLLIDMSAAGLVAFALHSGGFW